MTDKPVWLLDIDGVINAVSKRGPAFIWPRETWHTNYCEDALGRVFPILWAEPVRDFIIEMSEIIEIRWHTTWQHRAQTEIAPALGLPHFEVQDAPESEMFETQWLDLGKGYREYQIYNGPGYPWWKMNAALRLAGEGRNIIWTDDDLSVKAGEHFLKNGGNMVDTALIGPISEHGLAHKHLEAIRGFTEEVSQAQTVCGGTNGAVG
jgi:hypothetical protein